MSRPLTKPKKPSTNYLAKTSSSAVYQFSLPASLRLPQIRLKVVAAKEVDAVHLLVAVVDAAVDALAVEAVGVVP